MGRNAKKPNEEEKMESNELKGADIGEVLVRAFRRVVPNTTAIEMGSIRVTYSDLDKRTQRTARCLKDLGVEKGVRVGVVLEDRIDVVAAAIAIWRVGGVFVPLPIHVSERRLSRLAQDVCVALILGSAQGKRSDTEPSLTHEAVPFTVEVLADGSLMSDSRSVGRLARPMDGDPDECYVYFTSGSTGWPKAVVGRHAGLLHFVLWEADLCEVTPGTRVSQLTHPTFDPFLRDLLLPLCFGGTLCIPPMLLRVDDGREIIEWLCGVSVNLVHCVPSVLRTIINAATLRDDFPVLKWLLVAGAHLSPSILKAWYERFGTRIQIVNLYGPTETTLAKVYSLVAQGDAVLPRVPVGRAIPGAEVLVLDDDMNECGPLQVGEVFIRTAYRSGGYANDPELTSRVFMRCGKTDEGEGTLYRTGDLGCVLEDGRLDILGRCDRQVKVRGVRVELGGIEAAAEQAGFVREAAAVQFARSDGSEGIRVFLILLHGGGEREVEIAVRHQIHEFLPVAGLATDIRILSMLPRLPSGKVDYRSLASRFFSEEDGITRVPANSPMEAKLAECWNSVFGRENVGVKDDFFALGGNSLQLVRLAAAIEVVFGFRPSLGDLFTHPTVADQRRLLERHGVTLTHGG